jgi:hypothetical protein
MTEMQKIIEAEKGDLFDVLAHVAYTLPTMTREERAPNAKVEITTHFNSKQQVFLAFVLSHYVRIGVEDLDREKTAPLALAQISRHCRRRCRPRQMRYDFRTLNHRNHPPRPAVSLTTPVARRRRGL